MDVKQGGDLAALSKPAKSRSPQRAAKRFASAGLGLANEHGMAALCHRRASKWADALREGLDPDIACFIRDQAVAWQFLATYATSARRAPYAE